MSARYIRSPELTTGDGHKAPSVALLVALAMSPPPQTVAIGKEPSKPSHPLTDSHAEMPPSKRTRISNSVGLLQAMERDREEPTFVPLFLHPSSSTARVNKAALRKVMTASSKGVHGARIQRLINRSFREKNFSQHFFTHLRALASTSFPEPSEADKQAEVLDVETSVALKQIEVAQRWFAVHFRTLAQIMRASLYFASQVWGFDDDGTFLATSQSDPESFTWSAFSNAEIRELHNMSKHFKELEGPLISKIRALGEKLDPESKKQWSRHAELLGFKLWSEVSDVWRLQNSLHFITWMLNSGPPKFFAEHRSEFAEVPDLLTQYSGETDGPSTRLLKNLGFLGRAMRDLCLTTKDLEPFEEHCNTIVAHKYWLSPTDPFP